MHTGQHYDDELSAVFFASWGSRARSASSASATGTNTEQTARMLAALGPLLAEVRPDAVLVYGDTNSTLAGGLAAAQAGVPVAHVEAGMRSFDRAMPEELNRVLTDHLSRPAARARRRPPSTNLEREGVAGARRGRRRRHGRRRAARPAPRARGRRAAARRRASSPASYVLVDRPPRRQRRRPGAPARGSSRCCSRCPVPVVLPLHPRTRARLEARGTAGRARGGRARARCTPPLGYLAFTVAARPRAARCSPTPAACRRRPTSRACRA